MSQMLLHFVLGALSFWSQEVPGVRLGPVDPLTGETPANFRHADLNGDGAADLLLHDRVLFQEGGGFPADAEVALPPLPAGAELDVWGQELFVRAPGALQVYRWEAAAWALTYEQPIAWPRVPSPPRLEEPLVRFGRFLHDFHGDGVPELLQVSEAGLHIFAREDSDYHEQAVLNLLPPARLAPVEHQTVWPPERRQLQFPARQMAASLLLDGPEITVLTRQEAAEEQVRYLVEQYALAPHSWGLDAARTVQWQSAVMPPHLRPVRLNAGDSLGFGGSRWMESRSSPYPLPIHELWASLDGGASFTILRAPSFQRFRPHVSFLDINGNGKQDMVLETATLFEAGPRELLTQLVTRPALDHVLRIHFQRDGTFSKAPDVEARLRIALEAPPVRNSPLFQRYQTAEVLNLTGDFDGNGFRDILLQQNPGELHVYLAREGSYGRHADVIIPIAEEMDFGVYDLNQNGLSDIILQPRGGARPATVYFSQQERRQ